MSVLHWHKDLAYKIAPKSGPMRVMETLLDANQALLNDLPKGSLRQPHWRAAAQLLARASETGEQADIQDTTAALLRAIEQEGWMTRRPAVRE
jgi:hypothetical protein